MIYNVYQNKNNILKDNIIMINIKENYQHLNNIIFIIKIVQDYMVTHTQLIFIKDGIKKREIQFIKN